MVGDEIMRKRMQLNMQHVEKEYEECCPLPSHRCFFTFVLATNNILSQTIMIQILLRPTALIICGSKNVSSLWRMFTIRPCVVGGGCARIKIFSYLSQCPPHHLTPRVKMER